MGRGIAARVLEVPSLTAELTGSLLFFFYQTAAGPRSVITNNKMHHPFLRIAVSCI